MRLQVAEHSTIGKRQNNEDTVVSARMGISGHDLALLGVFDGVGGHADGETASRIAAEMLLSYTPTIAGMFSDSALNASGQINTDSVAIAAAMWRSDAAAYLHAAVQKDTKNAEMATTCVAAAMSGDSLIGWWLGDSRAYLFRDGKLELLTVDHSTVVDLGLSDEEALEHPKRSQITKFLRASSTFEPSVFIEDWREGDVVLLVSDGVSGSLTSWELESFLAYWLISDITAKMLAERLLAHISLNQSDNASVAVAIRGTPRPLGNAFPQVPLPALLGCGLTDLILNALVSYPASSAEWDLRQTPPWRSIPASTPVLNPLPRQPGDSTAGTFVEVISRHGERTVFGPTASLTLAASDGVLREMSSTDAEELVAFKLDHTPECLHISTPLGAQLETHVLEVLDPLHGPPLSFTVEDHIVIVASSEHNSLDTPIRLQQRTSVSDCEDTLATDSETKHELVVEPQPETDLATDVPSAPDANV